MKSFSDLQLSLQSEVFLAPCPMKNLRQLKRDKSRFIILKFFLALNQSLARTVIESDEIEIDTIDTGAEDPSKLEAARKEAEKTKNLQTLFKGTKKPT